MAELVNSVGAAWGVASQAPGIFITAALVLIACTFALTRLHYSAVIERRDAEIRLLQHRAPLPAAAEEPARLFPAPGPPLVEEWNTPAARTIRDLVKRVVEAVEDNETSTLSLSEASRQVKRIEESRMGRWLEDDLRQARRDFIRSWRDIQNVWLATARNPGGGVFARNEIERAELIHPLKDAADRLEAGLTGQPVPPAKPYGTD